MLQLAGVGMLGVLGYFLKNAHNEVKDLKIELAAQKRDFSDLSLKVATDFVRREEFEKLESSLEKLSDQLFSKFDQIADKFDQRFDQLGNKLDNQLQDVYRQIGKKADK